MYSLRCLHQGLPIWRYFRPFLYGRRNQLGKDASIGVITEAVKALGFTDLYEVALGGDMVAKSEAEEWLEAYGEGKKMTTSCCPAFVNMIKKHYPELIDNMSTTVSPMAATARLIKAQDPDAIVVFIGPCIAKKGEVLDSVAQDSADYALTFEELDAMFRAKKIDLADYQGNKQQASIYGKRFSQAGGVTKAVVQAMEEMGENLSLIHI